LFLRVRNAEPAFEDGIERLPVFRQPVGILRGGANDEAPAGDAGQRVGRVVETVDLLEAAPDGVVGAVPVELVRVDEFARGSGRDVDPRAEAVAGREAEVWG